MHEQNESQPKAFIKILFALFTALLVVVLGYLCIQIYTIFHRTYKTETAIAYTMSDNITLKGVAVFQAVDVEKIHGNCYLNPLVACMSVYG